jgi:hypothetical protein
MQNLLITDDFYEFLFKYYSDSIRVVSNVDDIDRTSNTKKGLLSQIMPFMFWKGDDSLLCPHQYG